MSPKKNSPPRSLSLPLQAEGNYLFPSNKVFWKYFSPAERGRTIKLKIWPKLNLQGYWSQGLISSTICNHFWFLFLCHNLNSSMLKCEGSLTSFIFTKTYSVQEEILENLISSSICHIKIFILTFFPSSFTKQINLYGTNYWATIFQSHTAWLWNFPKHCEIILLNGSLISNKVPNLHCVIRSEMNTASLINKRLL